MHIYSQNKLTGLDFFFQGCAKVGVLVVVLFRLVFFSKSVL